MAVSLQPVFEKRPDYLPIFKQIAEPERVIQFRVTWMDDLARMQVQAQTSSAADSTQHSAVHPRS